MERLMEARPAGIKGSLLMARVDAIKRPIFEEPKKGKWPGKAPDSGRSKRKGPTFDSAEKLLEHLNRS
jgi:hypothetical protein